MAKSKRQKPIDFHADEPALPCQSNLHGVAHTGFNKFEEVALRAMNGMLGNPFIFQLGLTPAEVKDMVVLASIQYADDMMHQFNCIKQNIK